MNALEMRRSWRAHLSTCQYVSQHSLSSPLSTIIGDGLILASSSLPPKPISIAISASFFDFLQIVSSLLSHFRITLAGTTSRGCGFWQDEPWMTVIDIFAMRINLLDFLWIFCLMLRRYFRLRVLLRSCLAKRCVMSLRLFSLCISWETGMLLSSVLVLDSVSSSSSPNSAPLQFSDSGETSALLLLLLAGVRFVLSKCC